MSWAGEPGDQERLRIATMALAFAPDVPAYIALHGLEIGGGPEPRRLSYEQYDAIDWSPRAKHANGSPVSYTVGDARSLPYAGGEFEHVFASNLLEHFPPHETTKVLAEWTRVLRVDGALELVVPDAMGILRDYFAEAFSWEDTAERLLGSRDYEGNTHYAAFTRTEFPGVLARVPDLELVSLLPSHSGGGIHAVAIKTAA